MKKITLLFFIFSLNLFTQDLNKVDQIIKSYHSVNSIEELAKSIDYNFKTDLEKLKAIYTWTALNIEYYEEKTILLKAPKMIFYTDENDFKRRKKRQNEKLILETFTTRKAICKGFALTVTKLCNLISLENELVRGYVRRNINDIEHLPIEKNHVWNAVKIDNKWVFMDVTFGAGYLINENWKPELNNFFFNTPKKSLNKTHYPSKQKWLDIMGQKPLKNFSFKPIFYNPFFITKAELISPLKGKINIKKRKKIVLNLKGIKQSTKISYSYNQSLNTKKTEMLDSENYKKIIIKSPNKDSDLNIFFNNELALQYRVIIQ
jgi:hypothetical protein